MLRASCFSVSLCLGRTKVVKKKTCGDELEERYDDKRDAARDRRNL